MWLPSLLFFVLPLYEKSARNWLLKYTEILILFFSEFRNIDFKVLHVKDLVSTTILVEIKLIDVSFLCV